MDNNVLIALVFDKPALWVKKHKFHNNRTVIDKCWKEISAEMKQDENKCRKKWRYLRDQFAVELGKMPLPCSEDESSSYPKWPYFKQLLFLKNVLKPRPRKTNRNFTRPGSATPDCSDLDETTDSRSFIDINSFDLPSPSKHEVAIESGQPTAFSISSLQTSTKRLQNDEYIENQKLQLLWEKEQTRQNQQGCNEDDEHLMFFKSLLPHILKIPQNKLLSFRNRIQDVVEEFAYRSQVPEPEWDLKPAREF